MIAEQTQTLAEEEISHNTSENTVLDSRSWIRYLLGVLVPALIIYLLPWFLLRIPSFERWGGSGYGPVMDYAYQTNGQNADIVLFGDSSEVLGIDPSKLSQELGVKVVALPNTIGSLRLTGEMAMQHYLAHNRPPKLIVLYVAPWNLNYSHEESKFLLFEGEEMLFRHGTFSEIFAFFKTHPSDTLLFPFRLYEVNPRVAMTVFLQHRHPSETAAATRGHYDPLYMVPPFDKPCELPEAMVKRVDFDSTKSFVARYSTPATKVMVYNAPIPGCSNSLILQNRSYDAVGAAPPRTIDPKKFKEDEYYVHLEPTGVDQATGYLRDAILSRFNIRSLSASQ
jgi:hypothetical protein